MREGLGSNAHGQAGAVISAIKSHTELDTAGRLALVAGSLGREYKRLRKKNSVTRPAPFVSGPSPDEGGDHV